MTETQAAPHPEFIERASSPVRVYTPSAVLDGMYHHPPGVRLSDSLRNQVQGERYILLTDVRIRDTSGEESASAFLLVNTQHASVIVPLDERA